MVGLLLATIDCIGGDEDTQRAYDRMTAHELFLKFNLSPRLVKDFLKPTLLVGLFKPPEELSALVVMELLYYYALAHQDSFDVRWIKNGTVADSLIAPLAEYLITDKNLDVRGGCRVNEINFSDESKNDARLSIRYSNADGSISETLEEVDGVIMALGCNGLRQVIRNSPQLARRSKTFSYASTLNGIDVMSVRLWLDRKVETRTPANVFARFEELRGAGGTFFMLDQLQAENEDALWGTGESSEEEKGERGSVLACDFYNAGALLSLSDEDIVNTLMKDLLPSAVPAFADAKVIDSWVGRYANTVSWFSPGSFDRRPPLEVDDVSNIKFAGDIVRMGEREHGAKGLCQERAYVSGIEAANALMKSCDANSKEGVVLPVRDDEEQFKLGVQLNKKVMQFLPRFWVR